VNFKFKTQFFLQIEMICMYQYLNLDISSEFFNIESLETEENFFLLLNLV